MNLRDITPEVIGRLREAARALVRLPKGKSVGKGEIVEIVTMTTYPETAWKVEGPVRKGQMIWCPAASDGSFKAGAYPCIAIGQPRNGYAGNLRWAQPMTQNTGAAEKPLMSSLHPEAFQAD